MALNVILRSLIPKYHGTFVYLIESNDYIDVCFLIQILTEYSESSVALVIKISPELNTDFECSYSTLEIGHKSQHVFTTQKQ